MIVKQGEHHRGGGGSALKQGFVGEISIGAGKSESMGDGFGNLKHAGGVGPGMGLHNEGAIMRLERILDRSQKGRKIGAVGQAIPGPGGNGE